VYVTSRSENKVYQVNGATLAIEDSIDVGRQPFGIAADAVTRLLYVADYGNGAVTVINMDSKAVVATHLVGYGPTFVAVDSTSGQAFVPLHPSNRVARFRNGVFVGTLVTRGDQVFSVALDNQASPKRLYIGRRGRDADVEVYDIDGLEPTYLSTLDTGGEVFNLTVDKATGNLYVLHSINQDGNVRLLSVFDRQGVRLTSQPVDVGTNTFDGGGISIAAGSGRVYIAGTECIPGTPAECSGYASSGAVVVMQGLPPVAVKSLHQDVIPNGPFGIAIDDSTQRVYITSKGNGGWLSVISDSNVQLGLQL